MLFEARHLIQFDTICSFFCHLLGVLLAIRQNQSFDLYTFLLLQLTVWFTHLFAHYTNEYVDFETDKLNANAGAWTGGSQVLVKGLLNRSTAARMSIATFLLSFVAGIATIVRYLSFRVGISPSSLLSIFGFIDACKLVPWDFVLIGFSVLLVAFVYSSPPFRLSANALGECCVAYVLSFAAFVIFNF